MNKPSVLRYSKKSIDDSKTWMEDIAALAIIVPDKEISFDECRNPDDVVYLAAADIAKANFIVSNDKDLLILKQYHEVDIISSSNFIFLMRQVLDI